MKILADVWERARNVASLSGQSMTQFVEEALEDLVAKRYAAWNRPEDDDKEVA